MFTVTPEIKGLIFDWDGTLIDTMPVHYLAWKDTVEENGAQFPEGYFYELAGVKSEQIVVLLNDKYGYQLDPVSIATAKEALFMEKYLPQAAMIEPVLALARQYKGKLPMAVATGGTPPVITTALEYSGLTGFFDAVVTSADVEHGKPAPDTFLEAAHQIGVEPELCMVFEDGEAGLEGARKAGMVTVDVRPVLAKL
jgi:beta-phosphoglucomutase family hydrolase